MHFLTKLFFAAPASFLSAAIASAGGGEDLRGAGECSQGKGGKDQGFLMERFS